MEKQEIKRDGGKPQKNSGRGKIQKADGVLEPYCYDIKEYEKSFKGTWNGESGVSQVLSRISYLGSISHLRRINLVIDRETKLTSPRKLHSSSWGYTCPIDNPDGKSIGLVKSLALFSGISTKSSTTKLKEIIFKAEKFKKITDISLEWNLLWTKVFLNSELIGDNIQLVTISSFTEINKAKEYLISLNKQAPDVIKLSKGNYRLSIISEKNYKILQAKKDIKQYLQFYESNIENNE